MLLYDGALFDGTISYLNHDVDIPASAVDQRFVKNLVGLLGGLGAGEPARRVPSPREGRFCDISGGRLPGADRRRFRGRGSHRGLLRVLGGPRTIV